MSVEGGELTRTREPERKSAYGAAGNSERKKDPSPVRLVLFDGLKCRIPRNRFLERLEIDRFTCHYRFSVWPNRLGRLVMPERSHQRIERPGLVQQRQLLSRFILNDYSTGVALESQDCLPENRVSDFVLRYGIAQRSRDFLEAGQACCRPVRDRLRRCDFFRVTIELRVYGLEGGESVTQLVAVSLDPQQVSHTHG